ncbi:MAG: hypothetical protein IH978_06890 [Nitrospinae bacterium]|nr:hypothetical protein [Nitrospinota bacterium]
MSFTCRLSHEFSRATGDVQKGALSKAAGALARGAYGLVREHDKGPTCLREAATAEAGNAADALFQHPLKGTRRGELYGTGV